MIFFITLEDERAYQFYDYLEYNKISVKQSLKTDGKTMKYKIDVTPQFKLFYSLNYKEKLSTLLGFSNGASSLDIPKIEASILDAFSSNYKKNDYYTSNRQSLLKECCEHAIVTIFNVVLHNEVEYVFTLLKIHLYQLCQKLELDVQYFINYTHMTFSQYSNIFSDDVESFDVIAAYGVIMILFGLIENLLKQIYIYEAKQ